MEILVVSNGKPNVIRDACEICALSSPSGCAKLSKENCLKEALDQLSDTIKNAEFISIRPKKEGQ